MPTGTRCPNCGHPVMPFARFLREAGPTMTHPCSHCHVELRRRRSVWWLLVGGTVGLVLIVGLGVPVAFERLGAAAAGLFVLTTTAVAMLGLKVCGWLFVGWEASESRR